MKICISRKKLCYSTALGFITIEVKRFVFSLDNNYTIDLLRFRDPHHTNGALAQVLFDKVVHNGGWTEKNLCMAPDSHEEAWLFAC